MKLFIKSKGEKIFIPFRKTLKKLMYINEGSYCFNTSHIYTLLSNDYQNLALSQMISGNVRLHNTNIQIDGVSVLKKELADLCCCVGSSSCKKGLFYKPTVRDEINCGIKHDNSSLCFDNIVNYFSLTHSRLDRLLKHTGNEHWRASLAIGYANSKKIYCFPYITNQLSSELIRLRIDEFIIKLKNEGNIIIIPSDEKSELTKISDIIYQIK